MTKLSFKKGRSKKQVPKKERAKTKFVSKKGIKAVDVLLLFILSVLAYLIIAAPFQRGLFFPKELFPVHIISFSLFVLWCASRLLRKEGTFLKTPLDFCVFALVVFYFLSFFGAVNKYAALREFLKVSNYFIIYLIVFEICRQNPIAFYKKSVVENKTGDESGTSTSLSIILHILLVAGVAVALGGLGTAAGTWDFHGAYVGGRIYTPLQYPNTAAAYLTATYFIALGLISRVKKWYLRPIYLVPAIVIFITFIFTYSRGAWLLMPLLAVLFILVIGGGDRLRMVVYLSLSVLVALLLMARLDNALRGENPALVWKYIFLAFFLMLAGGLLTELFLSLNWKLKAVAAGAVALFVLLLGVQVVLPALGRPLHLERRLNEKPSNQYLEQRVGNVSFDDKYLLSLEVDAVQEQTGEEENIPDYVWRLLVLGYDLDNEGTILLDHREGPTQGWEKRKFELQPGKHIRRMEVRFYNYFPGTAISARNVYLHDSRGERPLNFTLHRILPERIYSRMFAIGVGERSVEGRLTFYRDAFKIIRDYPLLGAGGGGWKSLYFGYQEQRYFTSEVHNHFLQVWIEAGALGFLAFVGIWVSLVWAFLRSFSRDRSFPGNRSCWATIFVPAVALGAHSAMDFNLSLGAVGIFLFALLGAGRSLDVDKEYFTSDHFKWSKKIAVNRLPSWAIYSVGILAGIFMLALSISLWNGYRSGVEAEERAEENRLQEALELYDRAIGFAPYQAANYVKLGEIYEHLSTLEENRDIAPQLQEMALDLTRTAYELEPYNPQYCLDYGAVLLRFGYVDEGLHYVGRLMELHPQQPDTFIQVARAQLAAAEYFLELESKEKASEHLWEVLLLEDRISEAQDSAEVLNFYLGKAAFLLGDYQQCHSYLTGVGEGEENYYESLVYLALIFEQKGEDEKANELIEVFAGNSELWKLYRRHSFNNRNKLSGKE